MTKKKVLITGATGSTGQSAVKKLLALDVPVKLSAALKGITEAYYLYPIQVPGIVESTAFFAQAAIDNDVKAIVNLSQMQASRDVKSHASQNHWIAEQILDRSGIPTTHLRPTLFAEWLLYLRGAIKDDNILPLPFGDVRYAPITGEDQGRVIAAILNHPAEHAGKIYPPLRRKGAQSG